MMQGGLTILNASSACARRSPLNASRPSGIVIVHA